MAAGLIERYNGGVLGNVSITHLPKWKPIISGSAHCTEGSLYLLTDRCNKRWTFRFWRLFTSLHRDYSSTIMQSADPLFPLFPIFSFLGFVLGLVPFAWHLQAWNAGTCAYMLWASLACLVEFINCMIWTGNAINRAPVWCDICKLYFSWSLA